jgi:hypothetical protein
MKHQWLKRHNFFMNEVTKQEINDFYYHDFTVSNLIDLKFRFIKIFCWDEKENSFYWNYLHRALNLKRIYNHEFQSKILEYIGTGRYPLRVFASASKWLNPDKIRNQKFDKLRLMDIGILSLESDYNLDVSVESSLQLNEVVEEPHFFVFSGNKSIHCYLYNINYDKWLSKGELDKFMIHPEKISYQMRERIYNFYQSKVEFKFDKRTATDPRRVIPLPNTLNAFTMKVAKSLDINEISNLVIS